MNFDFTEHSIGQGTPHVAVVAGVHGDELLGIKVLDELQKLKRVQGTLSLIVAHPEAVKRKQRYIQTDLNRSFPGLVQGPGESGLAHRLHRRLQSFDYVIDLHATSSNIPGLVIVTQLNEQTQQLLAAVPLKPVALMQPSVFGGRELIVRTKAGVALEFGPHKDDRNYRMVTRNVRDTLINLGVVEGAKEFFFDKEVYTVSEQYQTTQSFNPASHLAELALVRRGDIVGTEAEVTRQAEFDFYPLFLDQGRYERTLCLVARTKEVLNLSLA